MACGYAKLKDSGFPDILQGADPLEIERIYVVSEKIGTGLGSTLMKTCLEEAKGAGYRTIWLSVWEKNTHAIRFYEKWGFVQVGSQEFILGADIKTDVLMERTL